jgi:hypothetical protein
MDAREFIKVGMSAERMLVVPVERTVGHFVQGMPMVYATPMMILEMELASADAIRAHLAPGWITVGTEVDIRHLAATAVGAGADHGQGDRGGTPGDPVRGRKLRRSAPDRRGPPCPRPRECRSFYQALREELTTSPIPSSAGLQRRPRGSAAAAFRPAPSALPAPPRWCRRAR